MINDVTGRFIDGYNYLIENKIINNGKDFAKEIGISTSMMTEIIKGRTNVGVASIQNIVSKFNINSEWLLTGKGKMLKEWNYEVINSDISIAAEDSTAITYSEKPTPLVNQLVAAGFVSSDFSIKESDVKAYYVVPKFKDRKVDFMIEISGSSMYPKYNSGDVIACTIIKESRFIQWNKTHVIATKEQGLLVKRIKEDGDSSILAVSDNPEYPPFAIPKDEILGLAIVVGVIRLE